MEVHYSTAGMDYGTKTSNIKSERAEFLLYLQRVSGEKYDEIFYYIGGYDFDPKDVRMVAVVADLILVKATATTPNPYTVAPVEFLQSKLLRYEKGATPHPSVKENVERREKAEKNCKKKKNKL